MTALATLRSRSVAIIAATQSLDHLASVMGPRDFRALIPNFGTHFFFRSTEASAGNWRLPSWDPGIFRLGRQKIQGIC